MTLTTHAIVGASAATIFSFNPVAAVVAAFASHFVIDAIPHWDYAPRSMTKDPTNPLKNDFILNRDSIFDVARICFDIIFGFALSILIFYPETQYQFWIVFLGAGFGILPDPLQFAYWKIRREPLTSLQKFHVFIHSKNESLRIHNRWIVGLLYQSVLVVAWLGLTNL